MIIPLGYRGAREGLEAMDAIVLFSKARLARNGGGEWYVELSASDDALKLMFDIKRDYFTYELWNVIGLKSVHQVRMYELMKEHEYRHEWVVDLKDLRELLGVAEEVYPRYQNFKVRVLDACQAALQENTNIKFTCQPHKKAAPGGTIKSLKFSIEKNYDYRDPLKLEEYIDLGRVMADGDGGEARRLEGEGLRLGYTPGQKAVKAYYRDSGEEPPFERYIP